MLIAKCVIQRKGQDFFKEKNCYSYFYSTLVAIVFFKKVTLEKLNDVYIRKQAVVLVHFLDIKDATQKIKNKIFTDS